MEETPKTSNYRTINRCSVWKFIRWCHAVMWGGISRSACRLSISFSNFSPLLLSTERFGGSYLRKETVTSLIPRPWPGNETSDTVAMTSKTQPLIGTTTDHSFLCRWACHSWWHVGWRGSPGPWRPRLLQQGRPFSLHGTLGSPTDAPPGLWCEWVCVGERGYHF